MTDVPVPPRGNAYGFPTTCNSLIAAATSVDVGWRRTAFGQIFERYTRPLYLFLRKGGTLHKDAEDVVQGFFLDLWEGDSLSKYDATKGRFRNFMMASASAFRAEKWRKEHQKSRMPPKPPISLDIPEVVEALDGELGGPDPEAVCEREYFRGVLGQAIAQELNRLREKGYAQALSVMEAVIQSKDPRRPDYAAISRATGASEDEVGQVLHRFRSRTQETARIMLRSETADSQALRQDYEKIKRLLSDTLGEEAGK